MVVNGVGILGYRKKFFYLLLSSFIVFVSLRLSCISYYAIIKK